MARWCGAGLLACAAALGVLASAWGQSPAPADEGRDVLVAQGEVALARGDAARAVALFERAGAMRHAADAEMGLVRALMQVGAHRRAMTLAAHAAGAHRDAPAAAVLYAWLLDAGGQAAFGRRVLDESAARAPGSALVAAASDQLRRPAPVATRELSRGPWRMTPYDVGERPPPAQARLVASGTLIDEGRRALAPLESLCPDRPMWVRDGLGRSRPARVERRTERSSLAVLELEEPIRGAARPALAPRDPFAGSPAFAFAYAAGSDGAPAWPLLRAGFVGAAAGAEPPVLRVDLGGALPGGPVFDLSGRLVGMAARSGDGERLVTVSALRRELGEWLDDGPDVGDQPRATADLVYELAMPLVLQVFCAP